MLGGLAVARSELGRPCASWSAAGFGLAVSMVALALSPTLWLAVACRPARRVQLVYLVSGSNAVVQLRADPAMRGRVLALYAMVFLGTTPIGGPIIGWVSDVTSARVAVAVGGVATGAGRPVDAAPGAGRRPRERRRRGVRGRRATPVAA